MKSASMSEICSDVESEDSGKAPSSTASDDSGTPAFTPSWKITQHTKTFGKKLKFEHTSVRVVKKFYLKVRPGEESKIVSMQYIHTQSLVVLIINVSINR